MGRLTGEGPFSRSAAGLGDPQKYFIGNSLAATSQADIGTIEPYLPGQSPSHEFLDCRIQGIDKRRPSSSDEHAAAEIRNGRRVRRTAAEYWELFVLSVGPFPVTSGASLNDNVDGWADNCDPSSDLGMPPNRGNLLAFSG